MSSKTFFKAPGAKASKRRSFRMKFVKSYVSLFFVLLLGVTSTFAWFSAYEVAEISSGDLEFQSASSLRINKDQYSANKITIPAFTLDEASSLDGRNIYFPVGESFSDRTADMFFREGNTGDENVHYVYKNFELKGTSGNTRVFIKSYKIQVGDDIYQDELKINYTNGVPTSQSRPKDNCPVRLAFIADSGQKPVVIDPSAQVINYVDNSEGAVALTDENGKPTLQNTYPDCNWDSFSSYYYEHTPLFIIPGGQSLNVTLVVWLEGTLPHCQDYLGKTISVDIDIESNFAEMDTITFVDDTIGDTNSNVHNWIDNLDDGKEPIIACSYKDPYSTEDRWKTVIMRKTKTRTGTSSSDSGSEWQCEIPKKAVTDISFFRLTPHNGSNQAKIFNSWHTKANIMTMVNQNIPDDWYVNGSLVGKTNAPLQETRTFFDTSTNTNDNALIYTAIHGNKYSSTSNEAQNLSPCIGYWDYSAGSGSSSTGGGGQQTGGGSSSHENCEVTVICLIPNDIAANKAWVKQNTLLFETESGGSYTFANASWDNNAIQKTFTIPVGDKITKFRMTNGPSTWDPFGTTSNFTIPDQPYCTITYQIDNSSNWNWN